MPTQEDEELRAELERTERRRVRLRKKVQLLKRRLERADGELATLAAAPDATRTQDLSYVFIVTYGRSGSTLLQGILSSTPGWVIRGENGDAMRPLYEFHRLGDRARDRNLRPAAKTAVHAWFGMDDFPTTVSIRMLRELALATILRPEPDTRVTGFKEIRWWRHDDLPEYVAFLREVFPGARFVVNTRRLEDVARSKWWAEHDDPLAELHEYEKRIFDLHERLGDASYHVRYDDYVADPRTLAGLFDWLGESFDEQRVRGVLAQPHSY